MLEYQKCTKPYTCELCDYNTNKLSLWVRHSSSTKHKNLILFIEKKDNNYYCKLCNVTCNNIIDLNFHIYGGDHNTNKKINKKDQEESDENENDKKIYKCNLCNKEYFHNNSFWYHKRKCNKTTLKQENNTKYIKENILQLKNTLNEFNKTNPYDMISELIKQNNNLQNQLIEMSKETKQVITTNNTNSNNKTTNNQFNLNFFLNETCKNAMNITDFIESIEPTVSDLEETGRLGYEGGISRIIVNSLKKLDVTKRPIHCTDIKRETIYVKDEDKWHKENENKEHMINMVNKVAKKNLKNISVWTQENPDYVRNDDKNKAYVNISLNALGPYESEDTARENGKIIKSVLKTAYLDRKHDTQELISFN